MTGNRNIITEQHLSRLAMIYIRQSTPKQVRENTGSTARQYDLREKAKRLGWKDENIIVIDEDQGMSSGAFAKKRSGFVGCICLVRRSTVQFHGTLFLAEQVHQVRPDCVCH